MDKQNLLLNILQFCAVEGKFTSLNNPKLKEMAKDYYEWINKTTEEKTTPKATARGGVKK